MDRAYARGRLSESHLGNGQDTQDIPHAWGHQELDLLAGLSLVLVSGSLVCQEILFPASSNPQRLPGFQEVAAGVMEVSVNLL